MRNSGWILSENYAIMDNNGCNLGGDASIPEPAVRMGQRRVYGMGTLMHMKSKMNLFQRIRDDSFSIFHVANKNEIDRLLRDQLRIAAWLIAIIGMLELAMYFVAEDTGLLATDLPRYLQKYFLIPTGMNALLLLAALVVHRWGKRLRIQACANCLLFAGVTFVIYTVHMHFDSLVLCFAVPILMTIVFGDVVLTTVVALFCMGLKVVSDVFIIWDPSFAAKRLLTSVDWIDFVISLLTLAGIYGLALQAIRAEQRKHRNAMRQELDRLALYEESITDPVTGILNRKGLRNCFNKLMEETSNDVYTMVMMDMDHFKEINDIHGHLNGDQYLRQFAALIAQTPGAQVFRYGGDEFCMLLRGYAAVDVLKRCQNIQEAFCNSEICTRLEPATISFGAAVYAAGMAPTELLRRADVALYRAKQTRARALFYSEEMERADG